MKKIALDSMIFIYHFEQTPTFFGQVGKILSSAKGSKFKLITSIVSVVEALSAPRYSQLSEVVSGIERFFQETPGLVVFPVDWEISQKAAELRRENRSLRTPDAIQLATAIVGGADVFITNDRKLRGLKLAPLKVRFI
ncbi:MAG TPA: PIN domain-containing protein [Patescibacteria group bacterium]|nr:PIN domain-containing protein [Patescibacteria group bacterium]